MNLILTRYSYAADFTQGRLMVGNALDLHTLENPWRGNAPFVSCIPEGHYEMEPYDSARHPHTWRIFGDTVGRDIDSLSDTVHRFGILVHIGNKPTDTSGCVLAGTNQDPGRVWDSAEAMRQLNLILGNQRHLLQVIQHRPFPEYLERVDPVTGIKYLRGVLKARKDADAVPDIKPDPDDTIREDEPIS